MSFLTGQPIQLDGLIAEVAGPDRGGVASFLGMVRDHHQGRAVRGLEYSAYDQMAEEVCREILLEAAARWPVRVTLRHRLGNLAIGDVAVAVVAAGGHRDEAFTACRYVIEELKRRVPIWKKETYSDGTMEWVNQQATGSRQQATGRGIPE
ncbi:MAG TPA: molybdenum cofactor biosynthesis protein MoaE [Gemmatimonadales bacterium]|nr:molybdenum cofactor biosynthesis protein MoaE [Gemmatimonadales bacterium]